MSVTKKIPDLNDFDELLHEVSPVSLVNKADSTLLNISDLEIHLDKNKFPVLQQNDKIPQALNSCSFTNYDKFGSLLIGCCCAMDGLLIYDKNKAREPDDIKDESKDEIPIKSKETPEDWTQLIENICKYNSKMSKNEEKQLSDEMLDIWVELIQLLHFGEKELENEKEKEKTKEKAKEKEVEATEKEKSNEREQLWILRLAMLLFAENGEIALKLGFADAFVRQGEDKNTRELLVKTIKSAIDGSFKSIIYTIGSFVNLYETIGQCKKNERQQVFKNQIYVFVKFAAFFNYFSSYPNNSHFLLTYHYPTEKNGQGKQKQKQTLLGLAQSREKELPNLCQLLSKYSMSSEIFDEILLQYSDYIHEMFSVMRNEFTVDEVKHKLNKMYDAIEPRNFQSNKKQTAKDFCTYLRLWLKNKLEKFNNLDNITLIYPSNKNYEIVSKLLDESNELLLDEGLESLWNDIQQIKSEDGNFRSRFSIYFSNLSHKLGVKAQLSTVLTVLLFEYGIFIEIWDAMETEKTESILKIEKYGGLNLIDVCMVHLYGETLFHRAVECDNLKGFEQLIKIDKDVQKFGNKVGTSVSDEALLRGQWSMAHQIATSQMGSRMRKRAIKEEEGIEMKRGIAHQFLKQRLDKRRRETTIKTGGAGGAGVGGPRAFEKKEKDNENVNENDDTYDELLEELLLTLISLIESKLALSDDMLLICWKYEMSHKKSYKENRLWNSISKTITSVLNDSKNKRNWLWFEKYILSSVIWYELVDFAAIRHKKEEEESGIDKKWLRILHCKCGEMLELGDPHATWAQMFLYVDCSKCNSQVGWDKSYLCGKGLTTDHPKGYALCDTCVFAMDMDDAESNVDDVNGVNDALVTTGGNVKQIGKDLNVTSGARGVLFNNIVKMANDKLVLQKEALKERIDSLANNNSWKEMINYKQDKHDMIEQRGDDGELNLRQDNSDYVTYPNRLGFDIKKLQQFKLKDFYDSNVYLPNLLIVGNALNDKFHDVLENDILKKDFHCQYYKGPLKKISRCQAKSESVE